MPRIILRRVASAAIPATLLLLAAGRSASDTTHISGRLTMKYAQQHPLPLGDASGPVLFANEAKGTNANTGNTEYMNGADVTSIEIADLTQGNGPHQGYITFRKGGDSGVNRWSGRVTTALAADHKPVTTFEGTWAKIGGTGRYEGVTGKGRYQGQMISPTEYEVRWEGEIELREKAPTP